jgi:tryptophan halogenase
VKKYKFVILGAGTAGIISATYIKKYWGDQVDVTLVYDHKNPGIGVGESLTPIIREYLRYVGIEEQELIKNVNATVKMAMKFKNWMNDGKYFYHTFFPYGLKSAVDDRQESQLMGIYSMCEVGNNVPIKYYLDSNRVPTVVSDTILNGGNTLHERGYTFHIDATVLSKYIENKFKDQIDIIDAVVVDVIKEDGNIVELVTKDQQRITGDFFVDATGFKSELMKHMETTWIDKSDWLPINSFIPNPVNFDFDEIPPYTTSEGTDNGWILQVPLQNRWGSGYLFCDKFTSEQEALDKFSQWSLKTYNKDLPTDKVMHFTSGYWKDQWVGNCIAVGLCSGFAEPLEATNIHHTVLQIMKFVHVHTLESHDYDKAWYNKYMEDFYENIYLYIRFCYNTGRTDSEFWRYLTNNTPDIVRAISEKVEKDPFSTINQLNGLMFLLPNFLSISTGHGKLDRKHAKEMIARRGLTELAETRWQLEQGAFTDIESRIDKTSVSHLQHLNQIKNK